jgi:hypothetical protein
VRLFRVICSGSLVGASFLLCVACGSSSQSSDQGSPSPPSNASPATEGTGLESPQSRITDTNSISLPSLPSGNTGPISTNSDKLGCFHLNFLADKPIPLGMVVTVTRLSLTGPFSLADVAAAGCPQGTANPVCVGWQLRANSGGECIFAVLWDGTGENQDSGDVKGSVSFNGTLSCPTATRVACLRYANILLNSAREHGPAPFFFEPTTNSGSTSPPATGSTSPPATGSTSPPATGSTSPPATGST